MEIYAFKIVRMTKARIIMKRDVADISKTYHNFSYTQLGAEIFEFKVEEAPKTNDKKQAEKIRSDQITLSRIADMSNFLVPVCHFVVS